MVRRGGLGVQAVAPVVLRQRPQHARLVGAAAQPVEVTGECVGATGSRQRVHQVRLGLVLEVHAGVDAPGRHVQVEDRSKRVGRGQEVVLRELGPPQLVERDRAQGRVGARGGARVVRRALGVAPGVEVRVAHANVRLLAVARIGVLGDESLEERRRLGIALVREQGAGVEQHGVGVGEARVLAQQRAVERERAAGVHHRQRRGRRRAGGGMEEARHLLAERLPRLDRDHVGQAIAHVGARRRIRVALEERAQIHGRALAPAPRLGVLGTHRGGVRRVGRSAPVVAIERHAHTVGRGGQPVVQPLALGVERGQRALDGLAGDARAQRDVSGLQ